MMHLKYFYIFILSSLFCFSCSEKPNEDIIDMSEITPNSEHYKGDTLNKSDSITISFVDTLKSSYTGIIDSLKIDHNTLHSLDVDQFPDRFNAKFTQKMYWKTEKDSVCFEDWEFKDSLKTLTAFYNWLDCFGASCKTIKVGDKVRIHHRNILLLVNEKHILLIDSNLKIDQEKWLKILKDQSFGENWKFIVSQPKKGKASWSSLKDEVLTEIITQN